MWLEKERGKCSKTVRERRSVLKRSQKPRGSAAALSFEDVGIRYASGRQMPLAAFLTATHASRGGRGREPVDEMVQCAGSRFARSFLDEDKQKFTDNIPRVPIKKAAVIDGILWEIAKGWQENLRESDELGELLSGIRGMLSEEPEESPLFKLYSIPQLQRLLPVPLLAYIQYVERRKKIGTAARSGMNAIWYSMRHLLAEQRQDGWAEEYEGRIKDQVQQIEDMLINWYFPEICAYYGFLPYKKGTWSEKYHRLPPWEDKPQADVARQPVRIMDRRFRGTEQIRPPRGFEDRESIHRYLRHVAAALKLYFQLPDEVQCYYDKVKNVVYCAANLNASNTILESLGEECLVNRFMEEAYEELGTIAEVSALERRYNHRITSPFEDDVTLHAVPRFRENFPDGLHAERRILYYLRKIKKDRDFLLNPLMLGGIRRPCFVCGVICFEKDAKVNQGPLWLSSAASYMMDSYESHLLFSAVADRSRMTYITYTKEDKFVDNAGSESEEAN